MSRRFTIEKDEHTNSYVIYDDKFEPIMEPTEYISTLSSWNSKKNVAVALQLWFEFLYSVGLDYSRVETNHISKFRNWVKTPPEYRNSDNVYILYEKPHITPSTWMQYQMRISGFYDKYVFPKFPDCKISFKQKVEYNSRFPNNQEKYLFKERIKVSRPEARAININNFVKILDCCTNTRDRLILELFYTSGIRRGELFNIDIRQFKHVPRGQEHPLFTMYIHDSNQKDDDKQTKTGGREVRILTSLAEKISGYIDNEIDGRIINENNHYEIFTALKDTNKTKKGDPLKGQTISKIFKKAAIKAELSNATLHDLRHSYVTNLETFGIREKDLMVQTGHKNPKTLYGYRTHNGNMPDELVAALRKMDSKIKYVYTEL